MKNTLIDAAKSAKEKAYAPYSGFKVGAALLCRDGTIITGANIENASFGATMCAERNALFSAVAQGKITFDAIAVIGSTDKPCFPCGICLQAFSEFCNGDFKFLVCSASGKCVEKELSDLLPFAFSRTDMT